MNERQFVTLIIHKIAEDLRERKTISELAHRLNSHKIALLGAAIEYNFAEKTQILKALEAEYLDSIKILEGIDELVEKDRENETIT